MFDRYFKLLVERNAVETEVEALQQKLAADHDEATVIILGRMLLRTGNEDGALEVLSTVATSSAEVQAVLGDIYLQLARFDAAARAFEAALPAARTSERKRGIYEKLGQAQLGLGQRDVALATWRRIGELDGGKFHRRLDVAELMAEAGLLDEATAVYVPLAEEVKDDPARHCRVLRDIGRLHELRGQLEAALATYELVLDLTGRGNWMRAEVEQRVVQIYRRMGRLEELVTRLRTQAGAAPDDLAATNSSPMF